MNLWQTLISPDREELENLERREVGRAANYLQVGEFQVLQLAYREWFGKEMPDGLVDPLFHAYMMHNEVPHWARHYARQVVQLAETDRLRWWEARYHRYDHEYGKPVPHGVRRFFIAATWLLLMLGGSILVAELSVDQPTQLLPPYFDAKELPSAN